MRILAEVFRLEDWRRASVQVWVPLVAWVVTAVSTNVILILAQWPAAPWRLLVALIAGIAACSGARWVIICRQRKLATPTE